MEQEQTRCVGTQTRGIGGLPDDSHSLVHSPGGEVVGKHHFSGVNFPGVITLFCLEDFSRHMWVVNWSEIWDTNLGHLSSQEM